MPARKRAATRTSAKGARSAARERALTHEDVMQAAGRTDPELRRRSELLWEDRSPASRGPRAAFTPEEVVQAAMELADADGLSAVTMSAVASRLGYTAMAIYRYFPSKEALYDACIDAGTGQPPILIGSWREQATQWAHAKRAMLIARPWLAELPFVAAPHGPNWLLWLESIAAAFRLAGLEGEDIGQMLSIIDGYTRGASDTSISLARWKARGFSEPEWAAAVGADLGRALGDPRFPAFASILAAPRDGTGRTLLEGFDFGLQRILDGIDLYIRGRGAS